MAKEATFLHSHSALERDLKLPKSVVLVDEEFGDRFIEKKAFRVRSTYYYKVPILSFINQGGVFKNLTK